MPPAPVQPAAQAAQLLPAQRPAPPSEQAAAAGGHPPSPYWHRYHFPVGVFLIAYGVAGLLGTAVDWHGRRHEIVGYLAGTVGLGAGTATPVLAGIKFVEIMLTLVVVAGVARRRDVWFLPALVGWMAGFGLFCVLDLWAGKPGRLVEHGLYLAGFAVVLFISYALGVKVRVGRPRSAAAGGGKSSGATNLSRTQEIALAALNRWQRGTS